MQHPLLDSLQSKLTTDIPELQPGDTVRVHARIVEGNRERVQVFQGVVIRVKGRREAGASFTVRRIAAHGVGVERTFLLHSPRVEKVEVVRQALREHRWEAVVDGTRPFGYGLADSYRVVRTVDVHKGALEPRSGWVVRPAKILVPGPPAVESAPP